MFDDRSPNRLNDLLIVTAAELPVQLMHDDEPLALIFGQCERRPRQHRRMGLLGGLLNILRVMIATADDNDVLHTASYEQFAFAEEAQVAGPQEPTIAALDVSPEHLLRLLGTVPVALRKRRPLDEDFTDLASINLEVRLWLDDHDRMPRDRRSAADELLHHRLRFSALRHDVMLRKRRSIHCQDLRLVAIIRSGGEQCALGQPVARVERLHAEAGVAKRLRKVSKGLSPD